MIWMVSEIVILLFNHRKRALHDYLAGTIVIVKKRVGFRSILWVMIFLAINVFYIWFFSIKNDFRTRFYAEKGDPHYEEFLGQHYFLGKSGEPKDFSLAFKWFRKAAAQENDWAQYYLGIMYEKGYGITIDREKAIVWYSLAAKNGNRRAQNSLKRLESGDAR
jgi:hypothetical protein